MITISSSRLGRRRIALVSVFRCAHILPRRTETTRDTRRFSASSVPSWDRSGDKLEQGPNAIQSSSSVRSPYNIWPLLLPSLPPKPPRKASPHLTTTEIERFLLSLYHRFWAVISSHQSHGTTRMPEEAPSPELVKRFPFKSNAFALNFLRTVWDIADKEAVSPDPHSPICSL